MKRLIALALSFVIAGQSAYAGCWDQCITRNPFSGGCIQKVKICNWAGWQEDLDRVGKDVEAFGQQLDSNWKSIYKKSLPENVRKAINSSSVFPLGAYALGVDPTLIGGVLAGVVTRSVLRAEKGATVHVPEKPWIADLEEQGNQLITRTETEIGLAYHDSDTVFRSRIDGDRVWESYLSCLSSSSSQSQAMRDCYLALDKTLYDLRHEIINQVLASEK